jgi:hypothetical protein
VQEPFHKALLTGKTAHAAWRSKPTFYAVSTGDRTINPDLQRFMAKRMGAETIEVKASHVSLISQPDTIANLILRRQARDTDIKPFSPPLMANRAPSPALPCEAAVNDGATRGKLPGINAIEPARPPTSLPADSYGSNSAA